MRQHLISENLEQTTYNDAIFQRGINAHRDNTRNPFLSHLRKTPMSETHLDFLNKNLNIPRKALKDLQKRGFIIVTTANLLGKKKHYFDITTRRNFLIKSLLSCILIFKYQLLRDF